MTMRKTPDEIKKGLIEPEFFCDHCQHYGEPNGCNRPNGSCEAWDNADSANRLIRQLQDAVDQWEYVAASPGAVEDMAREIDWLKKQLCQAAKHNQQLEAERDAAVAVIRQDGGCNSCIYSDRKVWEEPCLYCEGNDRWKWRGVQKEDSND